MKYKVLYTPDKTVEIKLAIYEPDSGAREWHVLMKPVAGEKDLKTQREQIQKAIDFVYRQELTGEALLVWKRYFMSDPVNQAETEGYREGREAVSLVGQASLEYVKLVVWCYWVEGGRLLEKQGCTILQRRDYGHYFYPGLVAPSLPDEYQQTNDIFRQFKQKLSEDNLTMADNVIRTWIYVQGVDTHYAGMVRARKEFFVREGLTEATHYIASTGIEGKYLQPTTLVFMDGYAVKGLRAQQVQYLRALEYLSPTNQYGVTFERGTLVAYGDRKHIFISGTASIDKHGEVVHPLNIAAQTKRALENIKALLKEGEAGFKDVAFFIVYLRDHADYPVVKKMLDHILAGIPAVYVWAPVCRPGWLVEMECIAILENENKHFADF